MPNRAWAVLRRTTTMFGIRYAQGRWWSVPRGAGASGALVMVLEGGGVRKAS